MSSTENSVSQVQKMFSQWQGAASEQVGRVVDFWSEVGRTASVPFQVTDAVSVFGTTSKLVRESVEQLTQLSKKNVEHSQALAGEWVKLTRDSFAQAVEFAGEVSRIQLGALKKSGEVFTKSNTGSN